MSIAKHSVKNPILANILMIVITVLGAWSIINLPQELVPNISFPWIFVNVIDPGVSPEEMEKLVAKEIEDEIQDIEGITSVNSTAREGGVFVWIKLETMSENEFDKRLQDVRAAVDKVKLSATAEKPVIEQFKTQDFAPVISVVLYGDVAEREMKKIAEDLRDDIADLTQVSQASLTGIRDREIWVEVDPERLERYGVSMSQVGEAIRNKNLNLSGGDVKLGRWEWSIRTLGEVDKVVELEKVILRADLQGNHVRMRDVAQVRDTFEESDQITRFNGKPSVSITVSKKQDGNSVEVIDQIKALVAGYETDRLPPGMQIALTNDSSVYINDILSTLKNNAWMGMALVALALLLILGWRQALYAVIGIPVALAGTFIFMYFSGNSINGNSLFGLVLVLGMLVDDAVVVIENCYRYLQRGFSPRQAAVLGTKEVMVPVLTSSATTVAAFLPLMLLPGIMGDFMRIIPVIVSLALVASLFESFVILPAHIAEWSKRPNGNGNGRGLREKPLVDFKPLQQRYRRFLGWILRRRYWVIVATSFIMLGSIPLVMMMGVDLFADEEIPQFNVWVTMPEGTRLEVTDGVVRQIEAMLLQLPDSERKSVVAKVGIQERNDNWEFKPSVGSFFVEVVHRRDRERSLDEIMDGVRRQVELIPGPQSITLEKMSSGPPVGAPIEVRVKGDEFDELQRTADEVKSALRQIDGVHDVSDDFVIGKRELRLRVDEEKAALFGLSVTQVAGAVYNAFHGQVVTTYYENDENLDVRVRYRGDARREPADLASLKIATPTGNFVLLKDIATFEQATSFAEIKRDDRKRAIKITANIDESKIQTIDANLELQKAWPAIAQRHPGYALEFGGQFTEFVDAFKNLGLLFLLGILIMFTIMVAQFRSVSQPLIIFAAVIFAFWGAVIGLFVIGSPFSINNLFGLVALAGVAVNNSIVLIQFINNARNQGVSRWRSIIEAGKLRLRPILLTSFTTVVGLAPMAIGIGGYSEVWGPLATVIVWGLTASSLLSLFLIPVLYAVLGDVKKLVLGKRFLDEHGRLASWSEQRLEFEELDRLEEVASRRHDGRLLPQPTNGEPVTGNGKSLEKEAEEKWRV